MLHVLLQMSPHLILGASALASVPSKADIVAAIAEERERLAAFSMSFTVQVEPVGAAPSMPGDRLEGVLALSPDAFLLVETFTSWHPAWHRDGAAAGPVVHRTTIAGDDSGAVVLRPDEGAAIVYTSGTSIVGSAAIASRCPVFQYLPHSPNPVVSLAGNDLARVVESSSVTVAPAMEPIAGVACVVIEHRTGADGTGAVWQKQFLDPGRGMLQVLARLYSPEGLLIMEQETTAAIQTEGGAHVPVAGSHRQFQADGSVAGRAEWRVNPGAGPGGFDVVAATEGAAEGAVGGGIPLLQTPWTDLVADECAVAVGD